MKHFSVSLGNIAVAATDTDSDLSRKADNYLPTALEKVAETNAKEACETIQRGFSGSTLKVSFSSSDKDKFIREAIREFVRDASLETKHKLKNQIVDHSKRTETTRKGLCPCDGNFMTRDFDLIRNILLQVEKSDSARPLMFLQIDEN